MTTPDAVDRVVVRCRGRRIAVATDRDVRATSGVSQTALGWGDGGSLTVKCSCRAGRHHVSIVRVEALLEEARRTGRVVNVDVDSVGTV